MASSEFQIWKKKQASYQTLASQRSRIKKLIHESPGDSSDLVRQLNHLDEQFKAIAKDLKEGDNKACEKTEKEYRAKIKAINQSIRRDPRVSPEALIDPVRSKMLFGQNQLPEISFS